MHPIKTRLPNDEYKTSFVLQSKPLTIRQVALESALNNKSRSPSPEIVPHVEEQRALREETIAAFHGGVGEGDDGDDGLLVPREKTKDEIEREEEEYHEFLHREVGEDLTDLVAIEPGAMTWGNNDDGPKKKRKKKDESKGDIHEKSTEENDQEFLMKYVLISTPTFSSQSLRRL